MGIEPTAQAWEAITACLIPIGHHVASRWLPFVAIYQSQLRCQGWLRLLRQLFLQDKWICLGGE
jgi:hypothetical protein